MRRHALRKSMMEYVFGELKNTNSPNKLTLYKDEATTTYYPEVVSDTTNLKFYYISPSNYNVSALSEQSLTYNAGGTAGYNGKIVRYSWNWGKRNYSSTVSRTPGVAFSSDLSNIHFINVRKDAAYYSVIEELYCNTCTNASAEYNFFRLCYTASNLKKIRFNNYISLSESDTFLQNAFYGCTSLRFVDLGNIFKSNLTTSYDARGTFRNCHDITINVKDCDFSNATFNTSTSTAFIPNNSSIVIVYDTTAKLGTMQTKYSSVTYVQKAIMVETENAGDTIWVTSGNSDNFIGGDDGYSSSYSVFPLHDKLTNGDEILNDTSYKEFFSDSDCSVIKRIDLSLVDTSNVTVMQKMFIGCTSLEELNLSGKFSTLKVTDYSSMFRYSSSRMIPTTCKIYYNPSTMLSSIINSNTQYTWIPVDEHFKLF